MSITHIQTYTHLFYYIFEKMLCVFLIFHKNSFSRFSYFAFTVPSLYYLWILWIISAKDIINSCVWGEFLTSNILLPTKAVTKLKGNWFCKPITFRNPFSSNKKYIVSFRIENGIFFSAKQVLNEISKIIGLENQLEISFGTVCSCFFLTKSSKFFNWNWACKEIYSINSGFKKSFTKFIIVLAANKPKFDVCQSFLFI